MSIYYLDKHIDGCWCDTFKRYLKSDVFYTGNEFILVNYHECITNTYYDSFIDLTKLLNDDRFKFDNYHVGRVYDVDKMLRQYRKGVSNFNNKIGLIHYICYSSNNYKKFIFSNIDFKKYLLTSSNVKEHYKLFIDEINDDEYLMEDLILKNNILDKAKELFFENYISISDKQIETTTEFLIKQINKKL